MWLRALFRRAEVERELDDELRFHLERETEKLIRLGVSPEEAERRARRVFGGVERIKDDTRDARGTALIDALIHDVRQILRRIRRRPGFAVAVIVTLGLGLGANVAMFGIIDRLLLRTPSYMKDPARVHRVYHAERYYATGAEKAWDGMAYIQYLDVAHWTSAFDVRAAYASNSLPVERGDETKVMRVGTVSASYFDLFDARPVIGRFFTPGEDSAGAETAVAVLTWGLWHARYGGHPNVIGQTIDIGSRTYSIIGVAPPGFAGVDGNDPVVAFIPITAYAASVKPFGHPSDYYTRGKGMWVWMHILVRRRPGVTLAAATADLTHAFRLGYVAQRALSPEMPAVADAQPRASVEPIQVDRGPNASEVSRVALWTGGVALIVLLIACANVANLFLVRGLERRREHALRLALGVSRARLFAQVAIEIALFAAAAAILGLGVATAGNRVLDTLFLPQINGTPILGDWRTLAFAGLAGLITAGLTAVTPAIQASQGNLAAMIKDGAGASARASRLRVALLLVQGVLSVVLLVDAGLFVRSLSNVHGVRLGYDVDPVLQVMVNWRNLELPDRERAEVLRRLVAEAKTIPGVTNAARGYTAPFYGFFNAPLFRMNRDTVPRASRFTIQGASSEYFATLGTRVIRGRAITEADHADAPPVMVVNAPMAQALWPGQNAIGQCLRVEADTMPCATVVGIAESIKQTSLVGDSGQYYVSIDQSHPEDATLFVRTVGPSAGYAETVRRRLQRLAPGASFVTVKPLRVFLDSQTKSWQLGATMFVALGVLALVLAAVGLYSVIAYGVVQRTRELGVRVALGARTPDVVWLVLADGVRFTILGLVIGSAIALAVGRWVEPLLFGEHATDPLVFGAVTGMLTLTAVAASVLPARRATRVDPNVALRAD